MTDTRRGRSPRATKAVQYHPKKEDQTDPLRGGEAQKDPSFAVSPEKFQHKAYDRISADVNTQRHPTPVGGTHEQEQIDGEQQEQTGGLDELDREQRNM